MIPIFPRVPGAPLLVQRLGPGLQRRHGAGDAHGRWLDAGDPAGSMLGKRGESENAGKTWENLGKCWENLGKWWENLGKCWENLVKPRKMLGKLGKMLGKLPNIRI